MKKIKILLFDDVELLDFAGPLEVFLSAGYLAKELGLEVCTVAFQEAIRVAKTGLQIIPQETVVNAPIDLLIIPGGVGTRPIVKDDALLAQIDTLIQQTRVVASVCTGSLILARLGYLKGLTAVTHHLGLEELRAIDPSVTIDAQQRYIDHGRVVMSAGISAGIDMSLYLVEKYFDAELKVKVYRYMEYDAKRS